MKHVVVLIGGGHTHALAMAQLSRDHVVKALGNDVELILISVCTRLVLVLAIVIVTSLTFFAFKEIFLLIINYRGVMNF